MSQPSPALPPRRPDVVLVLWNQSDESAEEETEELGGEEGAGGGGDEDVSAGAEPGAEGEAEAEAEGEAETEAETEPGAEGEAEGEGEAEAEAEEEAEYGTRIEAQAGAVSRALRARGLVAASVDIADDIDRIIDAIVLERPRIVFNLVDQYDGDGTQHAAVASLLDLLGIPYTGSDPLALGTCQDRARTRLVLDDAGVPVPGYAIVRDVNAIPDTAKLRTPLIVTQAFDDLYDEDGTLRPIGDRETLEERSYELARDYDLPLLIEEYLGGRRLHAVVIGNRVLDVLPLCETHTDEDDEVQVSLSQLGSDTADRTRALARRAFRATGCRDVAQIDFHLRDGELVVTDVRPTVDVGAGSAFAVAASACEGGFDGVIHEIARQALRRARALEGEEGGEGTETGEPPAPPAPAESDAGAPTSPGGS